MFQLRPFAAYALFLALAAPAPAAEKPAAPEARQQKLIALLRSDAPPPDKAIACKQLAIYGGKEAVPALAPLLANPELASWARIALEAIPDPAADEALRQAVAKLQGRLLVGAINSIGVRRDAQAVEVLIAHLADADAEVASAAAVALGRIGGAQAAKTLEESLARAPSAARSAVAEGCILCAEKILAAGSREEAAKLYDLVRQADVPKQRVVEATRGAILARGAAGVPLLVEQWRSPDKALLAIGLRVARELPGREVTEALVAELGRATPQRQGLLLLALADRSDAAALPAVLQAVRSAPAEVRGVAMRVLERLGDASCIPILLDAAADADPQVAETALAVLAGLPGKEVDADLAARLLKAEGKARQALIQLAGRRAIAAAVPALLKAAEDTDAGVRTAALLALGSSITLGDLPVLLARVTNPRDPAEVAAAQQALTAACIRMPDAEACAGKLAAAMAQSSVAVKCRLLGVLSAMGGAKALEAVGAAARDPDAELQDTASRLLGEWMSLDAAPVLLDLAKTAADAKYKTRALRGYLRLARQFTMPDPDRADMCRAALALAERDAERKLVLEVAEHHPSLDTLKVAVDLAKIPAMKTEATAAAMTIVQRVSGESAEIRKLLAQVPYVAVKVEIIKAEYGAGKQQKDVTDMLRKRARDFPLIILAASDYNAAFGGDPAQGIPKQLKIQYRLNDKPGEVSLPENATILLPTPK
jgi:HEAT repeat protein